MIRAKLKSTGIFNIKKIISKNYWAKQGFALLVLVMMGGNVMGQYTFTHQQGTSWGDNASWTPGSYPGVHSTSGNPGVGIPNTQYAIFTGKPALNNVMIMMMYHPVASLDFYEGLSVGGIMLNRNFELRLANGGGIANTGTLFLYGATINAIDNVILRNVGMGDFLIDGINIAYPIYLLNLSINNTTENIINIDGTGGVIISCIISGTGKNLTKAGSGSGTLTLTRVNTYSGNTTISTGTLALLELGSIANSPNLTIGSGGTFDVSGLTNALSLESSQTLKSSSTGSNTTGTITVASSKNLTLSSGGLAFNSYAGGVTSALTVTSASAGELVLNSAPITVTTTTALAVGTYKLIAKSGSATGVTGTIGALSIGGSGLAANTTGALSISSGELILTVIPTNNWSGTTSNNWNTTSNWSLGTVPLSTDNITISSGALIMDVDYTLASGRTLTISGNTSLIVPTGKTLTIANGATFTLKSDANGTASIANSAGTITGNITVERYIPALRKFRFLASPVVGATAANWRNNGINTAGIGTQITGNLGAANNFDPSTTNSANAFGYNEALAGSDVTVGSGATSDPGWTAFTDGNTQALTNGKGFRILVRGDRTISLTGGVATPTNTTLSVTGTYPGASVSIATTKTNSNTNSGFNLVGNPYPATIDWNAVTKGANISTTYTIYDPTSGTYKSRNDQTGNASQYIASSQAFFVQQTGVTGGITIAEANKVSNAAGNYFRNKLADHLKISMKYDSANYDAAFIHFRADAQNDFDTYDGMKFQNAGVNIASIGADGKRYNINSLTSLNQTTEIPLSVLGSVLTNFELKFEEVESFKNHELYLIDHYLNKMILLSEGYTYPIELSSDSASVKDGRFKIVFVQKVTGIEANTKNANAFILYPNPAANTIHLLLDANNTNNENVGFEIFNQLGALMQHGNLDFTTAKDQAIAIDNIAQGSYFIKLHSNSMQQIIKFIK